MPKSIDTKASNIAKTVDEYLDNLPHDQKTTLRHVRQVILQTVPGVVESITYQIPTYKLDSKRVIYFAAFKNHLSLIPMSKEMYARFRNELPGLDHKGDTLHFSPNNPIPDDILKKLIEIRVEIARDIK